MPYLIDGNNLMHAMGDLCQDVGRLSLCQHLSPLVRAGDRVTVAFDGVRPPAGLAAQIDALGIEVIYCPDFPADEAIIDRLRADSAPRRLTVVSSDREIRKAARARRCRDVTSQIFAVQLSDMLLASPGAKRKPEPSEKREGLSDEQTQEWLNTFGFPADDE